MLLKALILVATGVLVATDDDSIAEDQELDTEIWEEDITDAKRLFNPDADDTFDQCYDFDTGRDDAISITFEVSSDSSAQSSPEPIDAIESLVSSRTERDRQEGPTATGTTRGPKFQKTAVGKGQSEITIFLC